jgi:hypothetical protein
MYVVGATQVQRSADGLRARREADQERGHARPTSAACSSTRRGMAPALPACGGRFGRGRPRVRRLHARRLEQEPLLRGRRGAGVRAATARHSRVGGDPRVNPDCLDEERRPRGGAFRLLERCRLFRMRSLRDSRRLSRRTRGRCPRATRSASRAALEFVDEQHSGPVLLPVVARGNHARPVIRADQPVISLWTGLTSGSTGRGASSPATSRIAGRSFSSRNRSKASRDSHTVITRPSLLDRPGDVEFPPVG